MIMPMDNSTDPPLRYLTHEEVEEEYGKIANMTTRQAYDVLSNIGGSDWIKTEESAAVLRLLIEKANITNDLDELTYLALEEYYDM